MKRYIFLFTLLFAFALAFSGCGSHVPLIEEDEEELAEITEPTLRGDSESKEEESLPVQEPPEEPEIDSGKEEETAPVQQETPKEQESASQPKPVQAHSEGTKGMVALTFDDGPHAEYTDQILDILEENGAVATFFEVGRNLYNDPDAVRREEALGCEVGSHSYRHADLGKMSAEDIAADLSKADAIFQEVLGHTPNLLRPPYGSLNKAEKYTTGRSIITWSIDTEDWLSRDVDKILAKVQEGGNLTGQVILMHSSYKTSVEATRKLVPWLIDQGYQLVTITELITQYYGDQVLPNGTYGYTYFKNGKDVILPPDQPKPEAPAQPEEPVQPEVPSQPEEPIQPEASSQPEEPIQPEASSQPEVPIQPEQPVQPETSLQPGDASPQENSDGETTAVPPVSGDLSAA